MNNQGGIAANLCARFASTTAGSTSAGSCGRGKASQSRRSTASSKRLRLATFAALATLGSSWASRQARADLLFDSISPALANGGINVGYTLAPFTPTGAPNPFDNTFTGGVYALPTGTTDITGFDTFAYNNTSSGFNALQTNIYVWGSVNLGDISSTAPAFSNLLGEFTFNSTGELDPDYQANLLGDGTTPYLALNSPLNVSGSSIIGVTVNFQGSLDGGKTFSSVSNLESYIDVGDQPSVGESLEYVYFGQQNIDTNGNFTTYPLDFGADYQNPLIRIFGDVTGGTGDKWNNNQGGTWEDGTNWSNGAAPGSGTDAVFNLSSPAPGYTVVLNQTDVCNNLVVLNDNVTISLGNIYTTLTVTNAIFVGNASTGTLTLANNYYSPGSPSANVSAGSVLVGTNGGTGVLVVGVGVNLVSAGAVTIGAGSALNISGGKLYAPSLSLSGTKGAWTGKLDIGTGSLDLATASLATVTSQAAQGYNHGTWNASGGIASAAAAGDTLHLTAVGVISNNVSGSALYGSSAALGMFEGLSPNLNDVLVKYTYYGDANLDGQVDGSDYSIVDHTYLAEKFVKGVPTTAVSGWYNGDFNYDSVVNGSDYTLMDNAFNQQTGSLQGDSVPSLTGGTAGVIDTGEGEGDEGDFSAVSKNLTNDSNLAQLDTQLAFPTTLVAPGSSVPEPASFGLLAICTVGMLSRRGQRR